MKLALAVALLLSTATMANAQTRHRCADDATARTKPLLWLTFQEKAPPVRDDTAEGLKGETVSSLNVYGVKVLPPVKALKGKAKLEVLETVGYVNRAEYRVRFIYAPSKDGCTLMGQEILLKADPTS